MKTSTAVGILIVLLLIIGAAWWAIMRPTASEPAVTTDTATTTDATDTTAADTSVSADVGIGELPMSATVTLTSGGFTPNTVTIAKGGTVTFVDQSGRGMWIGADEHPTHTEYDGTSRSQHCAQNYTGAKPFDQCGTGSTYSFTFTKAGSFDYHDHVAAQRTGTVVVQ